MKHVNLLKKVALLSTLCVVMNSITLPATAATLNASNIKHSIEGAQAPSFTLTTLSGKTLNSEELKHNKPIYLKFWATWCTYCTEEMPHLQDISNELGDDVQVIAINVAMNDSVARIQRYFKKYGYDMPTSFDENGDMVTKFNVIGTPQHIIIDKTGKVIHRSGLITDDLHDKLVAAAK